MASSVDWMEIADLFSRDTAFDSHKPRRDSTRKSPGASLFFDSQQHRISILVVAAFSLGASLLVVGSIIYDNYKGKVQHDSVERLNTASSPPHMVGSRNMFRSKSALRPIHAAEVIPFIIAISTIVQEGIIIGVQSGTIEHFVVDGCRLTAELVFPAIWITITTTLMFGLETTFRSIRRNRFRPRGRPDVAICLGGAAFVLLALWLTAFFWPMPDMCIGSLVWWTFAYNKVAVVLAGGMILTLLVCIVVTTIQLLKTVKMDSAERVAASRTVYSMGISAVVLSLMLPYYLLLLLQMEAAEASRIADISVNLCGIFNAVLHMVLRTNTDRLAIRAKETPWIKQKQMRLFGPNDLNVGLVISSPLTIGRTDSHISLIEYEKMQYQNPRRSPEKPHQPRQQWANASNIYASQPPISLTQPPKATTRNVKYQSRAGYSVFPSATTQIARASWAASSPTDTSSIVQLPPPPPLRLSHHHRKGSSQSSSGATIQIGLRLSHAGLRTTSISPESSNVLPIHSTNEIDNDYFSSRQQSFKHTEAQHDSKYLQLPLPSSRYQPPSPLSRASSTFSSAEADGQEQVATPSSMASLDVTDEQRFRETLRLKSLPPVPLRVLHRQSGNS